MKKGQQNIDIKTSPDLLSPSAMYDLYAPALYGKILTIVHKGPIANKILEKVFVEAMIRRKMDVPGLQTTFITMMNDSREKSYKTLKALYVFRECCAGATITLTEKK